MGPREREAYERKLARDRARLRRIYHERRAAVVNWYGGRCAICGSDGEGIALDLDHADASLKRLWADQPHRAGWLEEARENLRPLCVSCHVAKTREDRARAAGAYVERAQQQEPPF